MRPRVGGSAGSVSESGVPCSLKRALCPSQARPDGRAWAAICGGQGRLSGQGLVGASGGRRVLYGEVLVVVVEGGVGRDCTRVWGAFEWR